MKRTLLTIAVVLAFTGCGHSDRVSDRALVERTIQQYFHAAAFGDGETACSFLTVQARHGFGALLDEPAARECRTNVRKVARASVPMHFTRVTKLLISDDRATAYVTSERPAYSSSVVLVRDSRSWKLLYLPVAIHRFQPPRVSAPDPHRHG
jgi:hypothetical protein